MNDSKSAPVGPSDAEGLQSPAMRARLRLGTIVLLSAVFALYRADPGALENYSSFWRRRDG